MSNIKGSIPNRQQKYCTICGEKFIGGSLSQFCYDCKEERMLEQKKSYIKNKRIKEKLS